MSEASTAAVLARQAEELRKMRETLAQLKATVEHRADPDEVRQGLADITAGYALTGQLVEVYEGQRASVEELSQQIAAANEQKAHEQAELRELFVQVRELLRKLVREVEDLSRAIGAGDGAKGARTQRRKAS